MSRAAPPRGGHSTPTKHVHTRVDSPSQSVPKSATPRRLASVSLDHWTQLWNAQKRQGRPNVQTAREIVPIGLSRGLATRDQLCFDPGRPPPGGAKTAFESHLASAAYSASVLYCPSGSLPKTWMEMKPALHVARVVMSCAHFTLGASFCSKGEAPLSLSHHDLPPHPSVLV